MTLTKDPSELRKRWIGFYMNLQVLRSTRPDVDELLDRMKIAAAEFNEKIQKFLDILEG